MSIIVCPGIHEPELTDNFVSTCLKPIVERLHDQKSVDILIYPGRGVVNLSGLHIFQFLCNRLSADLSVPWENQRKTPVIFISFSAGVVGAMIAALNWQMWGGEIKAFIAIDGWGVPLWGNFPIHRLSHDYFTHWSSKILGSGHNNFYADPSVDHLEMWRSPQTIQGWWVDSTMGGSSANQYLSLTQFLYLLLQNDEKNNPENGFRN
jgi:hypothetical protein